MKGRGLALKGVTGDRHPKTKLSEERVLRMRQLRAEGMLLRELAIRYGISVEHVCRVCRGSRRGQG